MNARYEVPYTVTFETEAFTSESLNNYSLGLGVVHGLASFEKSRDLGWQSMGVNDKQAPNLTGETREGDRVLGEGTSVVGGPIAVTGEGDPGGRHALPRAELVGAKKRDGLSSPSAKHGM